MTDHTTTTNSANAHALLASPTTQWVPKLVHGVDQLLKHFTHPNSSLQLRTYIEETLSIAKLIEMYLEMMKKSGDTDGNDGIQLEGIHNPQQREILLKLHIQVLTLELNEKKQLINKIMGTLKEAHSQFCELQNENALMTKEIFVKSER